MSTLDTCLGKIYSCDDGFTLVIVVRTNEIMLVMLGYNDQTEIYEHGLVKTKEREIVKRRGKKEVNLE